MRYKHLSHLPSPSLSPIDNHNLLVNTIIVLLVALLNTHFPACTEKYQLNKEGEPLCWQLLKISLKYVFESRRYWVPLQFGYWQNLLFYRKDRKKVGGNNHVTWVMWTPKIVNLRAKWSDENNPSAFYGWRVKIEDFQDCRCSQDQTTMWCMKLSFVKLCALNLMINCFIFKNAIFYWQQQIQQENIICTILLNSL